MKWDVGTKLWLVPIRYWEEAENPEEVRLVEPISYSDGKHLYVYHHGYGHEVYVLAERCFAIRKNAIKAGKLLTDLYKLKTSDEVDWLMDEMEKPQFAERGSSAERLRRGAYDTGYVSHPSHHVHPETAVVSHLLSSRPLQVYADEYSAGEVVEQNKRCKCEIVTVHIHPIFPVIKN